MTCSEIWALAREIGYILIYLCDHQTVELKRPKYVNGYMELNPRCCQTGQYWPFQRFFFANAKLCVMLSLEKIYLCFLYNYVHATESAID